ncbi:MAG: hypothetical protein LBU32_05655 [Clostridiales bacterium]|nr:hypothetical protein [Clostridiales bacterium]
MHKGREGWPFSIKTTAGEGVPVEAWALPGEPAAGGASRSEISANIRINGQGRNSSSGAGGLVQEDAGEISGDDSEYIGVLRNLKEKAKELADPWQNG